MSEGGSGYSGSGPPSDLNGLPLIPPPPCLSGLSPLAAAVVVMTWGREEGRREEEEIGFGGLLLGVRGMGCGSIAEAAEVGVAARLRPPPPPRECGEREESAGARGVGEEEEMGGKRRDDSRVLRQEDRGSVGGPPWSGDGRGRAGDGGVMALLTRSPSHGLAAPGPAPTPAAEAACRSTRALRAGLACWSALAR